MEARNACAKDPAWQEFVKNGPEMLDEMNSILLFPSAHSPMK